MLPVILSAVTAHAFETAALAILALLFTAYRLAR